MTFTRVQARCAMDGWMDGWMDGRMCILPSQLLEFCFLANVFNKKSHCVVTLYVHFSHALNETKHLYLNVSYSQYVSIGTYVVVVRILSQDISITAGWYDFKIHFFLILMLESF